MCVPWLPEYLDKLNHEDTRMAVECERSFLTTLDGWARRA